MKHLLLEAAYAVETAPNTERAFEALIQPLARLRLSKAIYITRSDLAVPDWYILSTLPESWPRARAQDPDFSEPFVTYCCATFEPSKIGIAFLESHDGYIDDYTREYVASMARKGWTIGLGIPCCLKGSGRHGGFVLGSTMSRFEFERSVMPLVAELRSLCLVAHRKLDDLRRAQEAQDRVILSPREYQVMEYLSQGARPKGIASELGLSQASIRLYIKNARLKLQVSTNEEALMKLFGK